MSETSQSLEKRATGITGLDRVTRGGLPIGAATLLLGEPGAGKTILCLQMLANGPGKGVYVSFEESREQLLRDADSFSWGPRLHDPERVVFLDARTESGMEISGSFDLEGLRAAVGAAIDQVGAEFVVLDGLDQMLQRQGDHRTATTQVRELNEWSEARGLIMLVTGKLTGDRKTPTDLEGAEFLLPVVLVLSATLIERRLNRSLRVSKYRGSAHTTAEVAMIIDDDGIHLPYDGNPQLPAGQADHERVSTGVARLDTILGGGFYRGSRTLISGRPGTAKTTLSGSFAVAAAERGERVLYVSFDEVQEAVIRNLTSVGIDLRPHIDSGQLVFHAREAWASLVEEHYVALVRLLDQFQPENLVIDPVSALLKAVSADSAFVTTERLLAEARRRGITTVITSLTSDDALESESTLSHVSTLADTWIALDYNVRAGERNRSLSIVKSRGTRHSSQVRELVLSAAGVELADVFEFGSEVLMGTARIHKRMEVEAVESQRRREWRHRERELQRGLEQAQAQMEAARAETQRLQDELEAACEEREASRRLAEEQAKTVQRLRESDHDGQGGDR